jgi:hypothetical protein
MDWDNLNPQAPPQAAPQPSASDVPAEPSWDALSKTAPGDTPNWDDLATGDEKYGTPGQQAIAGIEGIAKGVAGPAATWAEKNVLGVKPEDIMGREEANPWTHGAGEAVGFGGSMLAGTGEAALVGKAGEAVAGLAGLGEAATTGSKLAKGAVTAATEMGLIQAGDEYSKWILDAPNTPGQMVANVGLATLLGGVGGPAFTGAGMAVGKALDSMGLKEFTDRLAFRKANIDPNEMMRHEAENAVTTFKQMNDEVTGANGLKAQAIKKILPEELTPEIQKQVQDLSTKSEETIKKMVEDRVPDRFIQKFQNDTNEMLQKVTNPGATVADHFDAINSFKQNLQDYSKGNWGPFAIPRYHEAYDFLNVTKSLSRDVRMGLEDSKVWGKAADLQKQLNGSWTKALPAMKDFEKKFMVKVGDQLEISQDKFNTYARSGFRNGRWNPTSYGTTDRQALMGNFIDAMDNHFNAVDKLYESAGVENPFQPVGMGTLKESLKRPSTGARLADIWHDKLSASTLGNTLGGGIGGAIGHTIGGGFEGAYLGKEVLGPVFSSVLKPLLEKYPEIDLGAFRQALAVARSIQKGQNNLVNASKSLFEGSSKTFPEHIVPDSKQIEKLDERTKNTEGPEALQDVSGKTGYYLPGHETAIAKTAGDATAYINAQRPQTSKQAPLDDIGKVSQVDKAKFQRTLAISQQPLMAMKYMREGTLMQQDVDTIKTLYPDYYAKMSEQIMQSLTDHLHKDGDVPYHSRQMLSLFLGHPMDSTLTPQSIMAAQGVFMQQNQQKAAQAQAEAKPTKNTSKLSKVSDSYMTQNQAASKRQKFGDA